MFFFELNNPQKQSLTLLTKQPLNELNQPKYPVSGCKYTPPF